MELLSVLIFRGAAGDPARGLVPRPVAIGDPPISTFKQLHFTRSPFSIVESSKAALLYSRNPQRESG